MGVQQYHAVTLDVWVIRKVCTRGGLQGLRQGLHWSQEVDVQGLWHQVSGPYIAEWAPAGLHCHHLGRQAHEEATSPRSADKGPMEHRELAMRHGRWHNELRQRGTATTEGKRAEGALSARAAVKWRAPAKPRSADPLQALAARAGLWLGMPVAANPMAVLIRAIGFEEL